MACSWYFDEENASRHARWHRWKALPEERRTLQPNVEATIREMQGAMVNGKLKVRGAWAMRRTPCCGQLGGISGGLVGGSANPDTAMTLEAMFPRVRSLVWYVFSHLVRTIFVWRWMGRNRTGFYP